jgi:oligopeptide/dipeptide ABC transporter ATP-binding protein
VERSVVAGEVGPASALALPSGCRFHPRCPHAYERCPVDDPPLYPAGPGHVSACHLVEAGTKRGRLAAAP